MIALHHIVLVAIALASNCGSNYAATNFTSHLCHLCGLGHACFLPPPTLHVVAFCLQGSSLCVRSLTSRSLWLQHHAIALGFTLELP